MTLYEITMTKDGEYYYTTEKPIDSIKELIKAWTTLRKIFKPSKGYGYTLNKFDSLGRGQTIDYKTEIKNHKHDG